MKNSDVEWSWTKQKNGELLRLKHLPTGVEISEELTRPRDRATRSEWQQRQRDFYDRLFDKLEEKVDGT